MMDITVFRPTQTLGLTGLPKCTTVTPLQMVHLPPCALCAGEEVGLGHQMQARHSLYLDQTTPVTVTPFICHCEAPTVSGWLGLSEVLL